MTADGIIWAKRLAREEGIFTGISGSSLSIMTLPKTAPEGSSILCMLPDTGERYLSTPLFDGIEEEMSKDEITLSRSTPDISSDISKSHISTLKTLAGYCVVKVFQKYVSFS